MLGTLDPILATLAVVLGLALVVQGVQQIFKQWLDLKSNYMRIQLLAMFDKVQVTKEPTYHGLGPVTSLTADADPLATAVVNGIEATVKSYGYKDLELLTQLSTKEFKTIVQAIDWAKIPGAGEVASRVTQITAEIDMWFGLAKKGFQDMYERRMKVWSFFTSLIVVIALNANLFDIYQQFTMSAPLRDAAISWAERQVAMPPDTTNVPAARTDQEIMKSIRTSVDSVNSILSSEAFQVLGWKANPFKPCLSEGWGANWMRNIFGWLVMTMLVSLGAPFWYDLLKTILGLKDRVKGGSTPAASQAGPEVPDRDQTPDNAGQPAVG